MGSDQTSVAGLAHCCVTVRPDSITARDPERATHTLDFLLILVTGHCIRMRDNCAGSRGSRSRSQRMSGRAQELGQSGTWGIFSSSQ
jgi:hypothetical protein